MRRVSPVQGQNRWRMESGMKLSIIVPVYNMAGDGKLEYCLNSLLSQEMEDYEIIAVDDKSTDSSLEILQEYARKYPDKLKVIASPENKRQGGAKNLGLEQAEGEWLGFIDSDDWVTRDMFPKLLQKAEETGADVVGCDYLITHEIGREEGMKVENNSSDQTGILDEEKYKKLLIKPGSMVIKIYKRALFEEHQIRFPEKMFYEDNVIGAFPLLYAKRFERVPECLYFYYQHAASTVHTIDVNRCMDRVKAMKLYLQQCKERGFYDRFPAEINYKVFELGYRNTLFSYLQEEKHPKLSFVKQMQVFLQENVPDFAQNPYYIANMDAENKKLIGMHRKNAAGFLLYYRFLRFYRKLRYGKN